MFEGRNPDLRPGVSQPTVMVAVALLGLAIVSTLPGCAVQPLFPEEGEVVDPTDPIDPTEPTDPTVNGCGSIWTFSADELEGQGINTLFHVHGNVILFSRFGAWATPNDGYWGGHVLSISGDADGNPEEPHVPDAGELRVYDAPLFNVAHVATGGHERVVTATVDGEHPREIPGSDILGDGFDEGVAMGTTELIWGTSSDVAYTRLELLAHQDVSYYPEGFVVMSIVLEYRCDDIVAPVEE